LTQVHCEDLWHSLFDDCWVLAIEPALVGVSRPVGWDPNGAVPIKSIVAGENRQAVTSTGHSVEGISTAQLCERVVQPFLQAHAREQSFAPAAKDAEFFRIVSEALGRLDRSGTAGPSSTTTREDAAAPDRPGDHQPGAPSDPAKTDRPPGQEFHQKVSAILHHPGLLRALGLVFDICIPARLYAPRGGAFAASAQLLWPGRLDAAPEAYATACC
jgi:hypothetical protein